MALTLSATGLISLLILPPVYLAIIRFMGPSYDLADILLRLILAEGISLAISLVIVLHFKIKARVPLPDSI